MECAVASAAMMVVGRISIEHVATALRKVQSMDLPKKTTLIDEINHPEQPLLALVIDQCTQWLHDLARRSAEKESDKFVMNGRDNLVNCIAHSPAHRRRASR